MKVEPLPGPDHHPEKRVLADARRMAALPARRPTEADAPPPSTFPMTPAAKAALELSEGQTSLLSSILAPMLNLSCPEGHRWYAPNPESWVDAPCGGDLEGRLRCVKPLSLLTPDEADKERLANEP